MGISKKSTLAKLPKDWREKMIAETLHSNAGEKFKAAVAVLMATGCRPEELASGVAVAIDEAGRLLVRIKGAKVGTIDNGKVIADRGQPWRLLTLDANASDATKHLVSLCSNGGKVLVQFNKDSLRTMVKRVACRVYPKQDGRGISPYCFRHAMAADLKSCDGVTDEECAAVMGHLSIDSIASYGRKRRGGGGQRPVLGVRAARAPRGGVSKAPPSPSRSSGLRMA